MSEVSIIVQLLKALIGVLFALSAFGLLVVSLMGLQIGIYMLQAKPKHNDETLNLFWYGKWRLIGACLFLFWGIAFVVLSIGIMATLPVYIGVVYLVGIIGMGGWKKGLLIRRIRQSALKFVHHQL